MDGSSPDAAYMGLLAGVWFRPVFIMGDHRSGTTLLYQLLDAYGCFNIVRAYHLIKYSEVLANHVGGQEEAALQQLDKLFRDIGAKDRIFDGVVVAPRLPEEYGFVLDDSARPKLTPQTLPRFVNLCKKVQYISAAERPLMLKNPWDYTNFRYIRQEFSQARFVFIHRNPIHVVNSQIKAARTLYSTRSPYHALLDHNYDRLWQRPLRLRAARALFSSTLDAGYRIAMRHVTAAMAGFLENLPALSPQDYVEIRYEDLCSDPAGTLERILSFLGIVVPAPADLAQMVRPRESAILDEVRRHRGAILDRSRPYLAHCGYPTET